MKYIIHSCNQRKWYVEGYLYPSLIKQGIPEEDILVYNDDEFEGNLVCFIKSAKEIINKWGVDGGVWHLQDDVVLSKHFASRTALNSLQEKIICGFCCFYDEKSILPGEQTVKDGMWWSFPCIYIPNIILKNFYEWVDKFVWRDNQYRMYVNAKKYDDAIFKIYVENYYPNYKVLNLAPNLVDHIDYMLGGSVINKQRGEKQVRAIYWDELDVINALEKKLKKFKFGD